MKSERANVQKWRFDGDASAVNVTNEQMPKAIATALAEALSKAILEAKNQLRTDLISWVLAEVAGECGGFTELCQVKVAIYAKPGSTTAELGK